MAAMVMCHGPGRHRKPLSPQRSEGRLKGKHIEERDLTQTSSFSPRSHPSRCDSHEATKRTGGLALPFGRTASLQRVSLGNTFYFSAQGRCISRTMCNFETHFWTTYFVEDCSAKGIWNLENTKYLAFFVFHNRKSSFCQLWQRKAF